VRSYGNGIATTLTDFTQEKDILTLGEYGVKIWNLLSLQRGSCNSRETRRERETVVKNDTSTGKTFSTCKPAAHRTGRAMGFRVTVAAHESNCKMIGWLPSRTLRPRTGCIMPRLRDAAPASHASCLLTFPWGVGQ
jgi:hypothetical protein